MFAFKILLAIFACAIGTYATNTCTSNKVTDFIVTHRGNGPASYSLVTKSDEINFAKFERCDINIVVKAKNYPVGCKGGKQIKCVKIQLGSAVSIQQHEPYTLYDQYGTPDLKTVKQILKAWTYTDSQCTKNEGGYLEQSIEVHGGNLGDFYVWNAIKNTKIDTPLDHNNTVCLPKGGKISIEATVRDVCVKRVHFELTGGNKSDSRTENHAPYFLYGDDSKTHDIYGRAGFVVGTNYTIEATSNGDAAKKKKQTFQFVNCTK